MVQALARVISLLPVAAVSLPGLLLAGAVAAVLITASAGRHVFWPLTPMTLPEAVWLDDAGTVVRLIQNGADPNAKGTLRAGVFREAPVEATPLEVAVASGRVDMVDLLVREGAALDGPSARVLVCLARKVGAESIVEYLTARIPELAEAHCEAVSLPW